MNILITGATGFIGARLVKTLYTRGHHITALVRNSERAGHRLGGSIHLVEAGDMSALTHEIASSDSIVNLAGESIIGGRWTPERRNRIRTSRIDLTARLVDGIAHSPTRPRSLISASAVGYYGDTGDKPVSEESPGGSDFLAALCADWEAAAFRAAEHGVRVVTPRIGIVLGDGGGALSKMLPAFRLGLGGRIGSGHQFMPWIHADDLIELIIAMITDEGYRGVFNAVAPSPVTNAAFTEILGRALGRRALLPVPGALLRLALGEAATPLITGQRAIPERILERGFHFRFDNLDEALGAILAR